MSLHEELTYLDSIYGDSTLPPSIRTLCSQPLVQRLRDIRLSNIDSISMPGIANTSRFEHSMGTAYLAGTTAFFSNLSENERTVFQAAGLLHDSAMQPFGHLIEEAFLYLGRKISHEERWREISKGNDDSLPGGMDPQIYLGLESGLQRWGGKLFGENSAKYIDNILSAIVGDGPFGAAIAGELDIDNLDNVVRAAHHMGLDVDKRLPTNVTRGMTAIREDGVVFHESVVSYVEQWLALRSQVYQRFMLSATDFAGKVMLISATIEAIQKGELSQREWSMTDRSLVGRFCESKNKSISKPVRDWLTSNLWITSDLYWMSGKAPKYAKVYEFSCKVSEELQNRDIVAYRIKDKTKRLIRLLLDSGEFITVGESPSRWLFGFCSSKKRAYTRGELDLVLEYASVYFESTCIGKALPELNIHQIELF